MVSLDCTIYMLGVFAIEVSRLIGTCMCSLFRTRHNASRWQFYSYCMVTLNTWTWCLLSTETARLIRDGEKGCVCWGVGGWEERGLEYHNIIHEVGVELFNWKVVVVVQINPRCTKGSYFAMSNCVPVLINSIWVRIVIYRHLKKKNLTFSFW